MSAIPHHQIKGSSDTKASHIKKILLHLLVSTIIICYFHIITLTDTYVWAPKGNEKEIVGKALSSIFFYKTAFWLIILNTGLFTITYIPRTKQAIRNTVISLSFCLLFYFTINPFINKQCAPAYYKVFLNQSAVEGTIKEPIKEAGYSIGPYLVTDILNDKMRYRRYAIGGLGEINYTPATENLTIILFNNKEPDWIRADAYATLVKFNTKASNKGLTEFRQSSKDSISKEIIRLGDYFATYEKLH